MGKIQEEGFQRLVISRQSRDRYVENRNTYLSQSH